MSRDFFYQGNRVDYMRPDEPQRIYRQPVRPEEVRARVAAHEATRPDVGGAEILRRIRDASDDEITIPGLDVSYSPVAMAMNAIPFSDEIVGLAADALTDADYPEAQQAAEESRALATATHTGSALVGGLGQAAITAPLALAAPATGATRAARVWSAARPAVIGGTALGATGGALTGAMRGEDDVDESQRIERAARDAVLGGATGAAIGTGAGLLGAAGSALAANPSSLTGFLSRPAGAALTGAGYAVASAPDITSEPITNLPGVALEAAQDAPIGAGMGAIAGVASEALTAVPRARTYAQRLFRSIPQEELASRRIPPVPPTGGAPDETAGIVADMMPESALTVADEPTSIATRRGVGGYADIARRAEAETRIDTGDPIENLVRVGLRRDPAIARLQSLGLSQAEIRRASARFGGDPRRLVAAAREHGLLPNRPYTQEEAAAAVDAVRNAAGADVRTFREAIRGLDASVSGASVADEVQALADDLAQSTSPASRNRSRVLGNIAEDLRYGPGVRPTADPATGEIIIPPERNLSPAELLDELDRYGADLQRAYQSADPSQDQEALMAVRRVLAGARDRLAQSELEPSMIPGLAPDANPAAEYTRANRAFQVASALDGNRRGVPAGDQRQAGMFRGWLESMAGGQLGAALGPLGFLGGRVGGFIGGRTVANYLPSLIATVNEGGFGPSVTGAAADAWPAAAQRVRSLVNAEPVPAFIDQLTNDVARQLQVDPSSFGRLAGVLEGAARRGTLTSLVWYLNRRDPNYFNNIQAPTGQTPTATHTPAAPIPGVEPDEWAAPASAETADETEDDDSVDLWAPPTR